MKLEEGAEAGSKRVGEMALFFLEADPQTTVWMCVYPSDGQRGCLEFYDAGAECLLAKKQTMCIRLPYSHNAYS